MQLCIDNLKIEFIYRVVIMKKLKKAYIEITNICNLSCAFCPGTSRKPEFMSADRFETVLGKLSGLTDHLYLHVMGEPLLHPEIVHFLELCGEYGYKVNLTTNGLLIREMTTALIGSSALRQMNFSLHSQEEVIDTTRLDEYLEDIFSFAELALEKGGIYISLRLWNFSSGRMGEQLTQSTTSPEDVDKYNAFVAQKLEQRFKPGFSVLQELQRTSRLKLREGLFLNCAEVFQWPALTADETGNEGFCLGLRDQLAVLVDGTVVPCCLDSAGVIRLGNIFKNDILEILEGERARSIYDGFSGRRALEELCRKCGYRTRFSKENELMRRIYDE
jgi:radical SAM protein with 4Fe4S-binding SPASM domain